MTEFTEPALVEIYDAITNPEARLKAENGFFARQLETANKLGSNIRNFWIMDAAAGMGYEAEELYRKGFDVLANEVDPNFRKELEKRIAGIKEQRREAFRKESKEIDQWTENRIIPVSNLDWRELPAKSEYLGFGGVLCVGNSITYMMNQEDLDLAIKGLSGILMHGGVLIIDHRNYNYILSDREHILADPKRNFRFKKQFYYVGDEYDSYYVEISDDKAVQEVARKDGKVIGHFPVHPWKVEEISEVLQANGLEEIIFSDFQPGIDMTADFFQHVAVKV